MNLADVKRLVTDSRKIRPGDTFVAYKGESMDGRDFIEQAIKSGAASVIWEKENFRWDSSWALDNMAVPNLREKVGEIASEVYGHPSDKLWVIGVTGTNGKTSTSHWIARGMSRLGRKAALIGTLGCGFPGKLSETANTTPDAVSLQERMSEFLKEGADAVVMEVSSHALSQKRVSGVKFDVAILTNLTRDHLDYHGDMDSYGAAKASLFQVPGLQYAVLNADDSFGLSLLEKKMPAKKIAYGFSDKACVRGRNLQTGGGMLQMDIESGWGSATLKSHVTGRFNASNLLASLSALMASGIRFDDAVSCLSEAESVPGRMQQIGGGKKPLVIVDYAHTPDALENVLQTLRESASGKLICVFGCGGDRDHGKRPLMGKIASTLSDVIIVTTDNPRSEEAKAIVDEIAEGMERHYEAIEDRAEAISFAVSEAKAGDIVLIAGKGHENYQEIRGVKHPFSDVASAEVALEKWHS